MGALAEWTRVYDLDEARRHRSTRAEASHQAEALKKLGAWYESSPATAAGGLLVLPTGAGKTFTAVRFLCRHPLSDGYKVLWLAHTHHLLGQALDAFGKRDVAEVEVGHIAEPKTRLCARVVSGAVGHSRVAEVRPDDDVVVATLQTIVRAHREKHAALRGFLDAAKGKIVVVFDEAHHAPAPSYTEFLLALRAEAPNLKLLGLTATPTYADESRVGWLGKLFPQRMLYQVSPNKLMAAGILAKPILIQCETKFEPTVNPAVAQRWRASYQDVPEEIVTALAKNQPRNDAIWKKYVDDKARFGKTIIFADRWYQCDYLRQKLIDNGVRADVIYSHVDADPGSVDARNLRARGENDTVLKAFRDGELDVIINVRMLTEGTDVPSVQSVFLTRQTTSQILLRQMVGRALRGPAFGGTASANIVLFMDDWRDAFQWAEFNELWGGEAGDGRTASKPPTPLKGISIALIRRLASEMESGVPAPASFLELLPIGWYVPEFDTLVEGTDDTEHRTEMVLVRADEKDAYEAFVRTQGKADLKAFGDPNVTRAEVDAQLEQLAVKFFPVGLRTSATTQHLFHLLRHMAQAGGAPPPFFAYEAREEHDLTPVVKLAVAGDWGHRATRAHLEAMYVDKRRFWAALFPTFELFETQFRHLVVSENNRQFGSGLAAGSASIVAPAEALPDREPSEEIKREIIERDGKRCLCCGQEGPRLQVDHIVPFYRGGTNETRNLQTLCRECNRFKRIEEMHFLNEATTLSSAPPFLFAPGFETADLEALVRDTRRTINMFYACAAVRDIDYALKGVKRYEWHIKLRSGNRIEWLEPHLQALLERVGAAQDADRSGRLRSILLSSSDAPERLVRKWTDRVAGRQALEASELHLGQAVVVYLPSDVSLPNEFLAGKVVRVDTTKVTADVKVVVGRTERVIEKVSGTAVFESLDRDKGAG